MTETYQINPGGGVIRGSDGAMVPPDPANADWQRYLAWVAQGNVASAAAAGAIANATG